MTTLFDATIRNKTNRDFGRGLLRSVPTFRTEFTATDAQVAPYATDHFQYDSQQRVTQAVVQGQAGHVRMGHRGEQDLAATRQGESLQQQVKPAAD